MKRGTTNKPQSASQRFWTGMRADEKTKRGVVSVEALQVEDVAEDDAATETLPVEERRMKTGHHGEHRLYRALLMQAVVDAGARKGSKEREEARAWFDDYDGSQLSPALSCEAVCLALEVGERELTIALKDKVLV